MSISIIIPTHNRVKQLRMAIESVLSLNQDSERVEFVVVDNNSTDGTKSIVESYSKFAKYVFEPRTSFTRARNTGAQAASGEILLYLDDDVIVGDGSLRMIAQIFADRPDCGAMAGRILPRFSEQPPEWALECQRTFNGWSLFDPKPPRVVQEAGTWEVTWAAGPMMAVRKNAFFEVGGFPPDTIGVETNRGPNTFNKLYIGPGDYGLCHKLRQKGYRVLYNPGAWVFHVIPPMRSTVPFWRSRMIGEGYHAAISNRVFFLCNEKTLQQKRRRSIFELSSYLRRLGKRLGDGTRAPTGGLLPEELWVHYHRAYLDMDWILGKYSALSDFLWKIGYDGVDNENYGEVDKALPGEFKRVVTNEYMYSDKALTTRKELLSFMQQRSIARHAGSPFDLVYFTVLGFFKRIRRRLKPIRRLLGRLLAPARRGMTTGGDGRQQIGRRQ